MAKALRYERQLTWTMYVVLCLVMAFGVYGIYFDSSRFVTAAIFLAGGFTIANTTNRLLIKELKGEIETLKSGDSTVSVDPAPPEDESATDE